MTRSLLLSTSTLTRFAVNSVEAALALDFIGSEYRTGNSSTTFADAFMGTSPKLTYSTSAGSNSTMVNSSGELVWATHNLVPHSEDFSNAAWLKSGTVAIDSTLVTGPDGTLSGRRVLNFDDAAGDRLRNPTTIANATLTGSIWVKGEGSNIGKDVRLTLRRIGGASAISNVTHTLTADWHRLDATLTQQPDNTGANLVLTNPANGNEASEVLIYGAHVYRSDLGGMAQVPGADTGFEYYVPTNGNPEYLPRVGHHVYNGSTWVNEGLLIESEPRTNLFDHSEAIVGSDVNSGASAVDGSTAQGANAYQIMPSAGAINSGTSQGFIFAGSLGTGMHTFSVLLKTGQYTDVRIRRWKSSMDTTTIGTVNLTTGVATDIGGELTVEPQGDGWYRVSWTDNVNTATTTGFIVKPNSDTHTMANGTDYFLLSQPQIEAAPTPSSYMPTNGGTYTRTAQSLTVPPAEFGWPEPEYIGPELVENGDFSTYADTAAMKAAGWSSATSTGTGDISLVAGAMQLDSDGSGNKARGAFAISTSVGRIYVVEYLATGPANAQHHFKVGSVENGNQSFQTLNVPAGTHAETFVATSTTTYVTWEGFKAAGNETQIDNISVREINPLSVSIQMDGRMTYADEGSVAGAVTFTNWLASGADYAKNRIDTSGSGTSGTFTTFQSGGGSFAFRQAHTFTPGINVPFNISSRHGSTFVNGAVDGTALDGKGWEYGDTTPTALPDLSGTDLQIASDYMGTIGTFRQFAGDIGDDGLEEATS